MRGAGEEAAVDLRTLARFPYLREASEYVRGLGVTLEALLEDRAYDDVRKRGIRRVLGALLEGEIAPEPMATEAEALREVLAYPTARMLASCVPDNYLLRRYAVAEAALAYRRLEEEPSDALALRLAEELGLDVRVDGDYRLPVARFLRATRAFRDPPWKLVNQRVEAGLVVVKRPQLLRLLQAALQLRIMEELPLPVNEAIAATFREEIGLLKTQLALRRERFRPEEVATADVALFPPCMQRLLAAVQASENVPHMGRFALVAFLHNIGVPNEEIYRIFTNVPDFAKEITHYQIEHITGRISGTEYTAPECSTMKSYGLCPGPDALCLTITHPLNYYRKKAWRRREIRPGGEGTTGPPVGAKASPA